MAWHHLQEPGRAVIVFFQLLLKCMHPWRMRVNFNLFGVPDANDRASSNCVKSVGIYLSFNTHNYDYM